MNPARRNIKSIMVITLSNIGDVVLTFPVLDILKRDYPEAKLNVVVGPKGRSLFDGNSHFGSIIVFDKHMRSMEMIRWLLEQRKEKYDMVIDLRNTAIPLLMRARYRTPLVIKRLKGQHMRKQHLRRLRSVHPFREETAPRRSLHFSAEDQAYITGSLTGEVGGDPFVVVSPGAADPKKRWSPKGFAFVCDRLQERDRVKIVLIGDQNDRTVNQKIIKEMKWPALDLSGKTTLTQMACLISRCSCAIVNDSAAMHIASYLDKPIIAFFGPTSIEKYGPWSSKFKVFETDRYWRPGISPEPEPSPMPTDAISPEEVLDVIRFSDGVVNI